MNFKNDIGSDRLELNKGIDTGGEVLEVGNIIILDPERMEEIKKKNPKSSLLGYLDAEGKIVEITRDGNLVAVLFPDGSVKVINREDIKKAQY